MKHPIEVQVAQIGEGMIVDKDSTPTDHFTYTLTLTAACFELKDWQSLEIPKALKKITGTDPIVNTLKKENGEFYEAFGFVTTDALADKLTALQTALNIHFEVTINFASETIKRRSSSVIDFSGRNSPRDGSTSPRTHSTSPRLNYKKN